MSYVLVVLLGTWCLFAETSSQGFLPQNIDSAPHNIYHRQLTSAQQSHILSDIQQHQHRFNVHQTNSLIPHQQQFTYQQQPSQEVPIGQQHHQQFVNQRPPPPQSSGNPIRFPQSNFQGNNNYQSTNNNNNINPSVIQHHTQTNFIPNFVQQAQPSQQNFQYQRSLQNQLQTPQQPFQPQLNQQQPNNFHQSQQQQRNQDFHAQNFLTLQNIQQQQALPQGLLQPQSSPQFNTSPQITPVQQFQPIPPSFQTVPQNLGPRTSIHYQHPPSPPSSFTTSPQIIAKFNPAPQIAGATVINPAPSKEQIIQKHEAFVQKQYEKQQNKVKQLHEQFQNKQQSIKQVLPTSPGSSLTILGQQGSRSRNILPSESNLFDSAIKKYQQANPKPTTLAPTTETIQTAATEDPFQKLLQAQRKDIYAQLKLESATPKPSPVPQAKQLNQEDLLQQLQRALAASPQSSLGNKAFDSTDIVLPNGQKVQVIRTSDPNLISGAQPLSSDIAAALQSSRSASSTTPRSRGSPGVGLKSVAPSSAQELVLPTGNKVQIVPAPDPSSIGGLTDLPADLSSLYTQSLGGLTQGLGQSLASEARIVSNGDGPPSLEELAAKGLIPEGYEIVQQPAPGSKPAARPPPPPPPKKKPTFVYLEEQADGSFKIQGVKANGEKDTKTSGAELDSILERIQKGEIQLPPSVTRVKLPGDRELILKQDASSVTPTVAPTRSSTPAPTQPPPPPTTTTTSTTTTTFAPLFTSTSSRPRVSFSSSTFPNHAPTRSSTSRLSAQPSTHHHTSTIPFLTTTPAAITERLVSQMSEIRDSSQELSLILKNNGLYAMSKYLKQSGLDNILNDTGPYTVFVPTDKAFKNLLVQLGGPERAEEKFKSNPRLLSGLLLHHVIPGAFETTSLQDEMTGVSLAGTQLRVNQYSMHDQEWNDVLVTTINGAMIVNDKQNIKIPQGIAHGVDRVMFPLPVGDLLQTLQADRERRFNTFLKVLYTSGMSELLQNKGTKTYTVFAPTDKAFAELDPIEFEKLTTDKDAAQAFAMKHIMPGTLFSAGMRFYQVKDSLLPGKTITLQKTSSGKIKVNEAQMITSNIPATNGVIHALDGPI